MNTSTAKAILRNPHFVMGFFTFLLSLPYFISAIKKSYEELVAIPEEKYKVLINEYGKYKSDYYVSFEGISDTYTYFCSSHATCTSIYAKTHRANFLSLKINKQASVREIQSEGKVLFSSTELNSDHSFLNTKEALAILGVSVFMFFFGFVKHTKQNV